MSELKKADQEKLNAFVEKKRNKINLYNCKTCGNTIVTEDINKGTTPMMLACTEFNGCEKGMMISMMYNVPPILIASYIWYDPTVKELAELPEGEFEHVKNGGLLIKKKR